MLLALAGLLVLIWIAGLALHLLGALIHLALVVAIVLAVVHFLRGSGRSIGASRSV